MITMATRSDRLRSATTRALLDELGRASDSLRTANVELSRVVSLGKIRERKGLPPFVSETDGAVRLVVAAGRSVADITAEIVGRGKSCASDPVVGPQPLP